MRSPHRLLALVASAVLLAACSGDEGDVDSVDLGDAAAPEQTDDAATSAAPSADATSAAPSADADGGTNADADGGTDADADGDGPAADDFVDTTAAVPGTWPVGDAGTVTFDVRDGGLVLLDVVVADGWDHVVEEEDPDELEVDFRRGGEAWDFEVELHDDGSRLEVDVHYDLRDADPGAYDLPDGGSFVFTSGDGVLTLTGVEAPAGWQVTDREEDGDEFSFTLTAGDRRVQVEVELDDGRVELEIDYRVIGPLPG